MTVSIEAMSFERRPSSVGGQRTLEKSNGINPGDILDALKARSDFFDLTTVQGLQIPHTLLHVPFIRVAAVDFTKQLPSFNHKPSNNELMVAIQRMAIPAEGQTVNLRTPSLEHERRSLKADGVVIFVNVNGEPVQVMSHWTRRGVLKLAGVTSVALIAACAGLLPRKPPDTPPTVEPFPTRTPVPDQVRPTVEIIPTDFSGTNININYLTNEGQKLQSNSPDLQPQPSPVADINLQGEGLQNATPLEYVQGVFYRKDFSLQNPLDVLSYAVAQGARQGTDGGVTYYSKGTSDQTAALSGLTIYRETMKVPIPGVIQYTVRDGYPRGLVLKQGGGISIIGKSADNRIIISFEEYLQRNSEEKVTPRLRYGVVSSQDLHDLINKRYLTGISLSDDNSYLAFNDPDTNAVRIVTLNIMGDDLMSLITDDAGAVWKERMPTSIVNNETQFGLMSVPVVPYPDKSLLPSGIDPKNLVYQSLEDLQKVGLYESETVTATDKDGSITLIAKFNSQTGIWEWSRQEIIKIIASDWGKFTEGENKGKYNPEMFFQLVGAINHQNRKTVSLEANGLKMAVAVDEQYFINHGIDPLLGLTALSQVDQQALADALSLQLDNLPDLKAQLSSIRTQIAANEGDLLSIDITRYTVIIQNGQITGIVDMGTDSPRRYVLNAEGKLILLKKEEEPQLMEQLHIEGSKFMEGENEVILRGAQTNHGVYDTPLDVFKRDIDWMQENGANFVVIQWNSGFLNRSGYKDRIARMCELAKEKGFRVEFDLHSRGLKPDSSWDPQQITVADDQIYHDWEDLLSDTDIANRLKKCVDIFVPISELDSVPGGNLVSWSTAKKLEERIGKYIREKIQNPDAIIGFTPPSYGSDLREVVADPPNLPNSAVDVHPYKWTYSFSNFEENTNALKKKGILVYVGEFGHEDPTLFIIEQYEFMVTNRISFAVAAINSASDNPKGLYINGGQVTENGELASRYWKAEK